MTIESGTSSSGLEALGTHWSFLLSTSGKDVAELSGESSIEAISGERTLLLFMLGDPAMVERSSSLWGPKVGLELDDREVASASSLRRASNSRSNLTTFGKNIRPSVLH